MNISSKIDKDFKIDFIDIEQIDFSEIFNVQLEFLINKSNNHASLYDNIKKYLHNQKNKKDNKCIKFEPISSYDINEIIKKNIIELDNYCSITNILPNAKFIVDLLNSIVNNKSNYEFMPTTVLYQHLNSQDNDSIYRLFNNRLLMRGFYSYSINYPEGIYRIIPQYILNNITVSNSKDNILCAIMLNNQLNFGYFLNSSIFNHKGIFEKPNKNSICYNTFIALIEKNLTIKSPLETYKNEFDKNEIIYKTSELSRIKSDDKLQTILRILCDNLGFRSSNYSINKIAKRQLRLCYQQKLLYSHSNFNKYSKNKSKNLSIKEELKNIDNKKSNRNIEIYEQMINNKYIKTYFWNSCAGECIESINSKSQYETVQLNQKLNNGLEIIKNISDTLSELWIAQFAKESEYFDGMLFQVMNSIVVELFDLKRILNNNSNIENIKLDKELITLIKEYGLFIKRIMNEGIYTSSREGLRLISITESFVSPVLSSFVTTNEFKDIHFEVFYAIDELFSNCNFTRILFKFLLCYYNNYSAPNSIYKFNNRLTQVFPYKITTIKKLIKNNCNYKDFIKEIQNESYYWNNCIDVANIYLLTPFSMLALIATSKKSLMYRCLKIINILNTENKVSAITYLNNIWKANVLNMPWTNFQVLNKKIVYHDIKGNSRVNEIVMTDIDNISIKSLIEDYIKIYKPFIKDSIDTLLEKKLLDSISNIYDRDYQYIYFNRAINDNINIDSIRIPFSDLRFSKYGYLFCSSNVQPKFLIENPICFHYSMIPEFEMSIVGASDALFINDNRHPVYYKFPYLVLYDKSQKHLIPIKLINKNKQKENIKDDFIIELKTSKGINPYIELCGTNMRTNISPIVEYIPE